MLVRFRQGQLRGEFLNVGSDKIVHVERYRRSGSLDHILLDMLCYDQSDVSHTTEYEQAGCGSNFAGKALALPPRKGTRRPHPHQLGKQENHCASISSSMADG